ncbi:MAG: FAD-dependent oxidoreductase, partial [Rhodospirillaceae bacterium]|nr:FAD-dependent oxidoreductase [Rhodospirillaceae bacterium]
LSGSDARKKEPCLSPRVPAAVYSPHDHQVDNRALITALAKAAKRAGAMLHPGHSVDAVLVDGDRATGIATSGVRHAADAVILAAGAWCQTIEGLTPEAKPPVRPIKGQMLSVQMPSAIPILRHVLWAPGIYLVPRKDGRLLIGATNEEKGFDETITAGGLYTLLDAAWRTIPGIEELPIIETWVGFRPGSRDDAPILGPGPIDGLIYATGHHRNGILLAPLTANLVSRFVLTDELDPALHPFTLARFGEPSDAAAA